MKRSLGSLAVALAAGSALMSISTSLVSASTLTDTFSVTPDVINVGDTALVDLKIAINLDPTYTTGNFTSGKVTLYSGIPSLNTVFNISNPSSSPLDFSATYTYPTLGAFTPSYYELDIKWVEKKFYIGSCDDDR